MGHLGELQAEGTCHHGIDDIDAAAMDLDAGQGIGEQGLEKGGPQTAGAGLRSKRFLQIGYLSGRDFFQNEFFGGVQLVRVREGEWLGQRGGGQQDEKGKNDLSLPG